MATGREAGAGYGEGIRGASTHRPAAATLAELGPNHPPAHCRLGPFWPAQAFQSGRALLLLTLQLWRTVKIKHCGRPNPLDGSDSGG